MRRQLLLWLLLLFILLVASYLLFVKKTASATPDAATKAAIEELNQACFYQTGQKVGKVFTDCVAYYHTH